VVNELKHQFTCFAFSEFHAAVVIVEFKRSHELQGKRTALNYTDIISRSHSEHALGDT